MNKLRIRWRIAIGFAVVLAALLLQAQRADDGIVRTAAATTRMFESPFVVSNNSLEATVQLLLLERAARDASARGEALDPGVLALGEDILRRSMDLVSARYLGPKADPAELGHAGDAFIQALHARRPGAAPEQTETAALNAALDASRRVTIFARNKAKFLLDEAVSAKDSTRSLSLVLSAVAAALAIVVAWVTTRSVVQPLQRLRGAMLVLAGGNTAVEVPGTKRGDEFGAMAQTVETFRRNALALAAAELAQVERMQEQAAVVERLAAGLTRLARGDLTCRVPLAFAPVYEPLRADFNAALAALHDMLGAVITNIQTVRSGTVEIGKTADDLSRQTAQQAASLQQTTAAIHEITATVHRTTEGTGQTRGVVAAARQEAERSEAVVREAVVAMGAIDQSAREIGQIIGVIDKIAAQSNLLSLNAAVEAARAGEAGRGFAVVASEVRALAQRSAEAARDIKALISASSGHVERGVTLVSDTQSALGRIQQQVRQISDSVNEIASGAHEQAAALTQVNAACHQMDRVTQENAVMIEHSTVALRSLVADTGRLEQLTARFDIAAGLDARAMAA